MPIDYTDWALKKGLGEIYSHGRSPGSLTTTTLLRKFNSRIMSSSQYNRGNQLSRANEIDRLVDRKQLTQDGADWATLRLDPYHDFERPISGYPDADSLDTVVSCFNYEETITKPAGSAGDWDLHVFSLPFTSAAFSLGTTVGGNFAQTATAYDLGLVNIAKADSGQPLFPNASPFVSTNFSCAKINDFTAVEAGVSRVIGFGIEAIDVTSALYKQGVLVAYKMPSCIPYPSGMGYLNTATTMQSAISAQYINAPPSLLGEAVQFKSSVTWEAKEGMYMAVGQVGVENPFQRGQYCHVGISTSGTSGAGVHLLTNPTATTALNAPPLLTSVYGQGLKWINCTQSGMFMSGLNNSAAIRIRVRVYVERAPLKGDTDLIPLANPSPAYDYKALALYSCAVSSLPIAVPVHFNAKGDWWRWIVRVIGAIAPTVGSVLNPIIPGAGAVGSGVGSIARAIVPMNTTANTKKKQIPPTVEKKIQAANSGKKK